MLLEVDHVEGALTHLQNHDVSYVVVARAPIGEIEAVPQADGVERQVGLVLPLRVQLRLSHVSFTPEQIATGRAFYNYEHVDPGIGDLSGDSVFIRDDAGQIFHTY